MDGWTLEYDGEEKPFAKRTIIDGEEVLGWGLANAVINDVNQSVGVCTFEQPGAEIDSEPIFEMGEVGIVRLDGVRKFWGEFRAPRRMGTSQSSGFAWRLENPWQALSEIHYEQIWNKYAAPEDSISELVDTYSTRVFLGQDGDGNLISAADQIIAIVNWAILQGAPLALDVDDIPSPPIPVFELRDAFCSECIIKLLQMATDAVAYFDYTTEPYPTLKIKRRGNYVDSEYVVSMPSVELTPSEGTKITSVNIVPRDELLARGWIIKYERVNTVNGVGYRSDVFDIWPVGIADLDNGAPVSGSTRRIMRGTINLEGGISTYAIARLTTVAITSNSSVAATRAAWWKIKRPDLAKSTYDDTDPNSTITKNLTIRAITRTGSFTYELTAGQYADWMAGDFGDETIEAYASYSKYQKIAGVETEVEKFIDELLSVKIKTTSLTSEIYRSNGVESPAESVPVGMAQFLYESTSVLQYDGDLSITERECSGLLGLGKVLNLMGGAEEFETMNALIQSVTYNISNGDTSVSFGPPKHLGPDDLMEMLRAIRTRQRFTPLIARTTGRGGVSGNTELGKDNAKESNTTGKAARMVQVWYDPSHPTGATVKVDITALESLLTTNGWTAIQTGAITPRVFACSRNNNGTCQEGKIILFCSEFIPN